MEMKQLLDQFRIRYDSSGRNKNRPGWLNMKCPFCGREPYLGYCIATGAFSCWNCGRKSMYEVLAVLTGLSNPEIRDLVKDLPKTNYTPRIKKRGTLQLPSGICDFTQAHRKYLMQRGFDSKTLSEVWGVKGTNFLGGHLAWRLFIPIFQNDELVSWTTRRLTDEEPRYHDAKPEQSIIPPKQCLYGLDFCRSSVILVEGPTGPWRIGPGAVSSFGLNLSSRQIELLSKFPLRIVLFDWGPKEKAAQRRARKLCDSLSVFSGRTIRIALDTGTDPATADKTEIEDLRRRYLR